MSSGHKLHFVAFCGSPTAAGSPAFAVEHFIPAIDLLGGIPVIPSWTDRALNEKISALDFIGIGFGPSNLALAVAAQELDPTMRGIFLERNGSFQWHPGIMLENSKMRISFLKDLVTLRNPASPYTFLQYEKAKGRLARFVNLSSFHPTRLEYQDYLCWVALGLSKHVKYRTEALKIRPIALPGDSRYSLLQVEVRDTVSGKETVYFGKNVIYAGGGTPRIPAPIRLTPNIIHSSEYLHHLSKFAKVEMLDFAVVGDGQSAGEIAADLLRRYPTARIHLIISGYALRPVDDSPFANEAFFSSSTTEFYQSTEGLQEAIRSELWNTNYGTVDSDLIDEIYYSGYIDEVKGRQRLFIYRFAKLISAQQIDLNVKVLISNRINGTHQELQCNCVVLATGYMRCLDQNLFSELLPLIARNTKGEIVISRECRARTVVEMDCGLYLQGYSESSFGIGDTLLSLLPFRSKEIFEDVCKHTVKYPRGTCRVSFSPRVAAAENYPPKHYLENDPDRLYAVMDRYKLATLISGQQSGEPIVTHVPLILDRSRGPKGVLFGHLDRANPHVDELEGRQILAIFQGPNAYISPKVYESEQLPTWNFIAVHVWGKIRMLTDRTSIVSGLASICERADHRTGAYRLDPNDPRIEALLGFIVAFEMEIEDLIGRCKLSQDRTKSDCQRAAAELARFSEPGANIIIEKLLGERI